MRKRELRIFFFGFFAGIIFAHMTQTFGRPPQDEKELLGLNWMEPPAPTPPFQPIPVGPAPSLLLVAEPKGRVEMMKVTAYCPCEKCCGKYADGKTAIGKDARTTKGVAADPGLLPYGTRLNIPGKGILTVDDTGGAMRRSARNGIYHIDVRFHDHKKALNWGVQQLTVEILD
ncbi:MAG: hypothetical protein FJZ07_02095 [Candidatus Nealsonbacteria bacterium]|nr:hypothetical protein [Candidatus Nealsonbacteria bacterium]